MRGCGARDSVAYEAEQQCGNAFTWSPRTKAETHARAHAHDQSLTGSPRSQSMVNNRYEAEKKAKYHAEHKEKIATNEAKVSLAVNERRNG